MLLAAGVALNRFDLPISTTDVIYFGDAEAQSARGETFIVLPLVFILVTASFIPLSRPLGKLFTQVRPLTGYMFDIFGSLAGTAAFFLISLFALPPALWFALLAIPVLALSSKRALAFNAVLMLAALGIAFALQQGAYWSPYYKVAVNKVAPQGYTINVNNVNHQMILPWQQKEPFYRRVYEVSPGHKFDKVLILGAGTGSDVATALANGAKSITAVEIDPLIQQIGAQLHPDKPYSDPRVHVVINDGRAFLSNTNEKYDLIIFALPDSLTLTSSVSSLRLESFLLTQDAIRSASNHLSSNGRGDTLQLLPREVAGGQACRHGGNRIQPRAARLNLWRLGPGCCDYRWALPLYHTRQVSSGSIARPPARPAISRLSVRAIIRTPMLRYPATDDWPFLYLPEHSFPFIYVEGLAMVALISLIGILGIAPRSTLRRFNWHMFFLGVAFALLEVKSLTTFALLFGSTWMVNSLVFFAILSSVLLAVILNSRFKIRHIEIFYVLLFAVLIVNIFVPPEALLLDNLALRYILASLLAFTPVFLANVIFSNSFRESEVADVAFASNLLGIMVGGMMEYFSMVIGYHYLLIPVILFYALALVVRGRAAEQPVGARSVAQVDLTDAREGCSSQFRLT